MNKQSPTALYTNKNDVTSSYTEDQKEHNRISANDYIAELTNLSKIHMRGDVEVKAISDITLQLRRECVSCFVGPSGCGKTTLLNIIGCIDIPTSGSINIMGKNVGLLTDDQLSDFRSQHLGYVFQNFNLIAVLSAYENIEYPLILKNIPKNERKDIVEEMLHSVGLSNRSNHWPSQLSGGEQQRVAIARALAKQPQIILADEPTANLDSRTSAEILELMQEMQSHYHSSIIFSTHDTETMKYADDIYRLVDGQTVLYGDEA
jgi:putative ABC transport system ATP-binding protein